MQKEIRLIQSVDALDPKGSYFHPLQSYAWIRTRQALGIPYVLFGMYEKDTLISVIAMTVHGMGRIPYKVGYIARSFFPDESVCEYIKQYAKENKIIFVKWEPEVFVDETPLVSPLLKKSPFPILATWTQAIDLTQTTDAIFDNFSKTVRRDIRFGQNTNLLTVESGTTDELYKDFENLFFKTTVRQKFGGHNRAYHKEVFSALSSQNQSRIFVVSDKNTVPVCASEVFMLNNTAYYAYAGSLGRDTPVGAMYLLIWSIIMYAKNAGCQTLDFWGSLPPEHDPNHAWAGFTKFKKSFGGQFKQYMGSYDLVAYPLLYRLYNIVFFLRKKLRR